MVIAPKAFRKADLICIISVLLLSVILFLSPSLFFKHSDDLSLKINVNGKVTYHSLETDDDIKINSNGISLVVCIRNKEAWIESTTCPDGICQSMGKLSENGHTAICAPACVAVSIHGDATEKEDADAITR